MYRLGTAILVLVPDKSRDWLVHAADNIGWDTVLYSVAAVQEQTACSTAHDACAQGPYSHPMPGPGVADPGVCVQISPPSP